MKVAVVIDTWFPAIGGGQTNTWEISKRIAKLGHQVDIITRNNGIYKPVKVNNLQIFRFGPKSKPDDNLSRILFLIKAFLFIKNKDYNVIHLQAFLPGLLAPLIRHIIKKPTIFTVHGTSLGTNLLNPVSKKIEEIILTKIKYDTQITVSRNFFKITNANKNVVYIPNGIDKNLFDKIIVAKYKQKTLLFVGRLHPQKNLINLIKAFKLVIVKYPKLRLLIVGEGTQKAELIKITKELKLEKNISFLGEKKQEDLIEIYKKSHLFILPSIYEGQPLVLLEASAAGLPIVATNVGGVPDIVKDGVNGVLIKKSLQGEISKAILKALKGYHKFRATKPRIFDWKHVTRKTLSIYKKLIKQNIANQN